MKYQCVKCLVWTELPEAQQLNVCPSCGAVQSKVHDEYRTRAAAEVEKAKRQQPPWTPPVELAPPIIEVAPKKSPVVAFFWLLCLFASIVAGLFTLWAMHKATSAPQEAAAAAMGCVMVIIPYVFTRAVEGLASR
jgi:hypothetical protein